jgi:uncharacterized protein (TIGR03437 family)
MRFVRAALFTGLFTAGLFLAGPAAAQTPTWDTSGNGLLSGTYYFREVIYVSSGDGTGGLSEALSVYGNISFDGNGNYTIPNGSVFDSSSTTGQVQTLSVSGTYSIAASGYGFFTNPLSSGSNVYTVYGLVTKGIFVGSTTEQGFNDMFIAAPLASPLPTNASFRGTYAMAGFLPGGTPATMADTSFQLNPDGAGNLGTVNITGYYGSSGSTAVNQTSTAKYSFSSGAANITFPNSTTAPYYAGSEFLYISPDGNFVFGGSPTGWDMFVGVRVDPAGTAENFGGMYYEVGLDENESQLGTSGYGDLDTFYGSFSANGGTIVGHERLLDIFSSTAEGFTYSASYPSGIPGSYTDSSGTLKYTVSQGGAVRIGYGVGPYLGLYVALQAPTLSGTGVYLNPAGVVNAASFAPFTAGISNGEFIVLYGTNLAAGTQVATTLPFPTTLGGVTVTINSLKCPIYYVTPTQIAVIVPYGTTFAIGQIQVNNNGNTSNVVTEFINKTTPGIFTLNANGLGYGAIEHANGAVVTPQNPAAPGETVAVYLSGLGNIFPPVAEGTAGPTSPLSYTINAISAYVGGAAAGVNVCPGSTTNGCGILAPYLAGLYQINVTIPSTATSGDNVVEILGPDSDTYLALVSVGGSSATASSVRPTESVERPRPRIKTAVKGAAAKPCFLSGCQVF